MIVMITFYWFKFIMTESKDYHYTTWNCLKHFKKHTTVFNAQVLWVSLGETLVALSTLVSRNTVLQTVVKKLAAARPHMLRSDPRFPRKAMDITKLYFSNCNKEVFSVLWILSVSWIFNSSVLWIILTYITFYCHTVNSFW